MSKEAIKNAVSRFGNQTALAMECGVTQQSVSHWVKGARVGVKSAVLISKKTGIPLSDLRPDIFGPAPQSKEKNAA